MEETKVTQEYGGEQIQVLEGLEAVRKKPVFHVSGSTSTSGFSAIASCIICPA